MQNHKELIQDLEIVLKKHGVEYPHISVETVRYRDGYFGKNDHIFDSSEYWFEDVEVDKTKWLFSIYSPEDINTDFEIVDVPFVYDVAVEWATEHEIEDDIEMDELTLDNIRERCPTEYNDLLERIVAEIEEKDYWDLEEYLGVLWGTDEETFNEIEALAYWTIYFEPNYWDEDVAWRVGLVPFGFKGDNYLALGGCGMDLSPRLDAYQALVSDSIPEGSKFIRQPDYAKQVVGEEVFDEVIKAIQGPTQIILTYEEEKP